MRPNGGRNSRPGHGWSRVKFSHSCVHEPKRFSQLMYYLRVVCWVQSVNWYRDASMSSKWYKSHSPSITPHPSQIKLNQHKSSLDPSYCSNTISVLGVPHDQCYRNYQCHKSCLNDGICHFDENGREYCNCLDDFTGENCENAIATSNPSVSYFLCMIAMSM